MVFGLAMLVNLVLASEARHASLTLELSNDALLDWLSNVILLLIRYGIVLICSKLSFIFEFLGREFYSFFEALH